MIDCIAGRWSPGIGDPTVMGWATVAAYFLASALTLLRAREAFASPAPHERALRLFWLGAAAALFFLAFNKQLDLQSALTAFGRCLAQDQGWYEERRVVQFWFLISIFLIGSTLFGAIALSLHQHLRSHWMVLTGFFVLLGFVFMRAAGFHHMDAFINTKLAGLRLNWVFELGALTLIIAGAWKKASERMPKSGIP